MNISQAMSLCLPCDLQRKIWKKYTQKYIFPELLQSCLLQRILARHGAFQVCIASIINFVEKAISINQISNNYFKISIDVLEDRILDDDWFQSEGSRIFLQIIMLTKQYISHPELLKMEIETNVMRELKNDNQIYVFASNLAMLTNMFS